MIHSLKTRCCYDLNGLFQLEMLELFLWHLTARISYSFLSAPNPHHHRLILLNCITNSTSIYPTSIHSFVLHLLLLFWLSLRSPLGARSLGLLTTIKRIELMGSNKLVMERSLWTTCKEKEVHSNTWYTIPHLLLFSCQSLGSYCLHLFSSLLASIRGPSKPNSLFFSNCIRQTLGRSAFPSFFNSQSHSSLSSSPLFPLFQCSK